MKIHSFVIILLVFYCLLVGLSGCDFISQISTLVIEKPPVKPSFGSVEKENKVVSSPAPVINPEIKAIPNGFPITQRKCSGNKFHVPEGHRGLDLDGNNYEKTISASWKGKVVKNGWEENGFGNFIVVEYQCSDIPNELRPSGNCLDKPDDTALYIRYAHLASNPENANKVINPPDQIGEIGSTGDSPDGPHLHLEVISGPQNAIPSTDYDNIGDNLGKWLDPLVVFNGICK